MWQYVCDHNSGKLVWFSEFLSPVSRKNIFTHTRITCSSHLNNVLTLPIVKMKHHILYIYNALLEYYPLHQAWCETYSSSSSTEKTNCQSQGSLCSKCPPLVRTQARKRVGHWSTASSISDCSKPRHTCSRRCRSSSVSWKWQWRHIYVTDKIDKQIA